MLHDLREGGNMDAMTSQDTTRQVQVTCHASLCLISN